MAQKLIEQFADSISSIVWTEAGVATPSFAQAVWMGTLHDAELQALLKVVDETDFWAISPGPDSVSPAGTPENELVTDMADTPSSVPTVNLSERHHAITIYLGVPVGQLHSP